MKILNRKYRLYQKDNKYFIHRFQTYFNERGLWQMAECHMSYDTKTDAIKDSEAWITERNKI